MKKVLFLLTFLLFISCKDTEFSAGLENRLTAIIDMSPETNYNNVDFTSDDNLGGLCPDHEMVYINKHDDGSLNNEYYVITIEAKDYFKSENNCNEYSWYNTEEEDVRHKLIINALIAFLTVIRLPIGKPIFEAGCIAAFLETLNLVFMFIFFLSMASNRRYKVISLVREAG